MRGGRWSGDRACSVYAACRERLDYSMSAHGAGGVHFEHFLHVCDAGRVEAQRLVERPRLLPRVRRRAYGVQGEMRAGRRKMAGDAPSSVQGRADWRLGAGHEEERTKNM